jgi:Leucine-rich repeat (LRR) protein
MEQDDQSAIKSANVIGSTTEIELMEDEVHSLRSDSGYKQKQKNDNRSNILRDYSRGRTVDDLNISFRTHVGWDGLLVLLFALLIAILFSYIVFLFSRGFIILNRPWLWVFVLFAIFYSSLTLFYSCTWKKIAKVWIIKHRKSTKTPALASHEKDDSFIGKLASCKSKFDINGEFFLWKLLCFEFIESTNQIINLTTMYLCIIPAEFTSRFGIILSIDAFFRAYQLYLPITVRRRDRQIKIDLVVDFICIAFPLLMLWWGYAIPIAITELLQITLWPSFCIFSKLRSVFRLIVRSRTETIFLQEQIRISRRKRRHRKSLFQQLHNEVVIEKQTKRIPKRVINGFCIFNIGYGTLVLVISLVHTIKPNPGNCNEVFWKQGCKIKIPYCRSLFSPSCDCAYLRIENNLSITTLPNTLVDDMPGLRKVYIRNCNLSALPPRMEQLTEMVLFEISFNRLKKFNVNISKWKKLQSLYLMNNNITIYNQKAIWRHDKLQSLSFNSNDIDMPSFKVDLPSLLYLDLNNNHITLTTAFSASTTPNLLYLYLNGNKLLNFPDESLKYNLVYLGVRQCNVNSVPQYLSEFKKLKYFDARDNNISMIDIDLKRLIEANNVESYFSGNTALCNTDSSLDCVPLCSKQCWSRKVANDGYCDIECNSEECEFDGGDC